MARPPAAPPLAEVHSFEKALEELESIVQRMEDGQLPLEESLAAYQRGTELVKLCDTRLSAAHARVAVLEGESLQDLKTEAE